MTRPDQNISRINPRIRINSPIRPTFNIPLTRPTENSPLTKTRPAHFALLTRPMEFSEEN